MADKNSMSLVKTYEADGEEITLSPNIVARLVCGRNDIPETEVARFIALCAARKLNPFTGDVYMIPYNTHDGVRASIVVGKETFTKRAFRNPRFRGMEAGVTVVRRDGSIERREGSLVGKQTEKLVGGWARVYVDGMAKPFFDEVPIDEYSKGKMWQEKPATMIRKVALVHVLREAFPEEFGGLYDASEMGDAAESMPTAPVEPETPAEPEYEQEYAGDYEAEQAHEDFMAYTTGDDGWEEF